MILGVRVHTIHVRVATEPELDMMDLHVYIICTVLVLNVLHHIQSQQSSGQEPALN